jgi:pimeloyl-ACP methyl ester carboxylesterase
VYANRGVDGYFGICHSPFMRSQEITVPENLVEFRDATFLEASQFMARLDLSGLRDTIPELQYPTHEAPAGYGLFEPDKDFDPTKAIVSFFPIANDLGKNMGLRHLMLQRSLPVPTQIVGFPHNTFQEPNVYELAGTDRRELAAGNMAPLIDRQLQTLRKLGIEEVQVIGDSIGSTIAAQFMGRAGERSALKIGHSVLFEPVNVLERSVDELEGNMRRGGLQSFLNAVNESGVPLYSKIQHTRGGLDYLPLGRLLLQFSRNGRLPDMQALAAGMTNDRFIWDILGALRYTPHMEVTLGRGERSLMTPGHSALALRDQLQAMYPNRVHMYSAVGRGHEITNHLPTFVLVARAAMQGQGHLLGKPTETNAG